MADCDRGGGGYELEPDFMPVASHVPAAYQIAVESEHPTQLISGTSIPVQVEAVAQHLLSHISYAELMEQRRAVVDKIDTAVQIGDVALILMAIGVGVLLLLLLFCFVKIKILKKQ